jgi:(p)ppGpp synthase/HD superfamily hydrolase
MNIDNLYHSVFEYAKMKHTGQFRKDGIEEYINHPFRVSQLVRMHGGTIEQQCAALLHDVVEDTGTSQAQLTADLSVMVMAAGDEVEIVKKIARYVDDLTCKHTPQSHPKLNRAQRKKLELQHLVKHADEGSRVIKLADIIDNLSSIEKLDPDFAEKYLFEDFMIIRGIKINHPIYDEAVKVFKQAIGKML